MKTFTINEGDILRFEDGRAFVIMTIGRDEEPRLSLTHFDEGHEPVEDLELIVEPGFIGPDESSGRRAFCSHKEWQAGRCAEMSCWNYVSKHAAPGAAG